MRTHIRRRHFRDCDDESFDDLGVWELGPLRVRPVPRQKSGILLLLDSFLESVGKRLRTDSALPFGPSPIAAPALSFEFERLFDSLGKQAWEKQHGKPNARRLRTGQLGFQHDGDVQLGIRHLVQCL